MPKNLTNINQNLKGEFIMAVISTDLMKYLSINHSDVMDDADNP